MRGNIQKRSVLLQRIWISTCLWLPTLLFGMTVLGWGHIAEADLEPYWQCLQKHASKSIIFYYQLCLNVFCRPAEKYWAMCFYQNGGKHLASGSTSGFLLAYIENSQSWHHGQKHFVLFLSQKQNKTKTKQSYFPTSLPSPTTPALARKDSKKGLRLQRNWWPCDPKETSTILTFQISGLWTAKGSTKDQRSWQHWKFSLVCARLTPSGTQFKNFLTS